MTLGDIKLAPPLVLYESGSMIMVGLFKTTGFGNLGILLLLFSIEHDTKYACHQLRDGFKFFCWDKFSSYF